MEVVIIPRYVIVVVIGEVTKKDIEAENGIMKVVEVVRINIIFFRTIKQIFEAQHRLKEKNWEYKLQVNVMNVQIVGEMRENLQNISN